jgi:hypothetical protein
MKILLVSLFVILGFSACTTHDDGYYDRANRASEKSLHGLEKDTK